LEKGCYCQSEVVKIMAGVKESKILGEVWDPWNGFFSNGRRTQIIQRKLVKFCSVQGLWTKIVQSKFYKNQ